MISQKNRYPGTQPFNAAQKDLFHGRKQETDDLLKMIRYQQVVVLHGKSGLGKSSLLNAGVVPAIEATSKTVVFTIRLNAYTEAKGQSPNPRGEPTNPQSATTNPQSATTNPQSAITNNQSSIINQQDTPLSKTFSFLMPQTSSGLQPLADDSLWFAAKSRQLSEGQSHLLLIFDQFEELFTYPEEQVRAFKESLAELLRAGLPQRMESHLEALNLNEDDLETVYEAADVKVLFSIRADRYNLMDKLSDVLPNILRHSYELMALKSEDARAAIVEPAAIVGDYISVPFVYSEGALTNILGFLKDENDRIEAIQLQTLCHAFETKVTKAQQIITAEETLPQTLKQIIDDYYKNQLATLSPSDEKTAQRLIEDELVIETGNGKGVRVTLHELSLMTKFVDKNLPVEAEQARLKHLLETLVNLHVVRRETGNRGGDTYELAHDRLIEAVLASKKIRVDAAERVRLQEEKAANAERLRLAEELARKETRRRQLATALSITSFVCLIAAIIFSINANRATKTAEAEKIKAEKALFSADSAKKEAERSQLAALESEAEAIQSQKQTKLAFDAAQIAKAAAFLSAKKAAASEKKANANLEEMKKARAEKLAAEMEKYISSADRMKTLGNVKVAKQILNKALEMDKTNEKVLSELRKLNEIKSQ